MPWPNMAASFQVDLLFYVNINAYDCIEVFIFIEFISLKTYKRIVYVILLPIDPK